MPTQTARSRRVQLHRVGKSFEGIESRQDAGKLRLHLVVDCVRHQDLARFGDGLCAGRGVDDRADGGHVAMGLAEFPETDLSGVDADADAKLGARQAEGVLEPRSPVATPLLDVVRRLQGPLDMVAVASPGN